MNRSAFLLLLCAAAALTAPLLAISEPSAQEVEENRRELEKLRTHPEKYALLERNARVLLSLSRDRREQIFKLDQQLHEQSSAAQARLKNVMARYIDWLDRLDPADRQKIQAATNQQERVKIIRELREQEWLKYQPEKTRKDLASPKLSPEKRAADIQKLREEDRKRKQEWLIAVRFWEDLNSDDPQKEFLPRTLDDLRGGVKEFVLEYLKPHLAADEWTRLKNAEGQWPLFPQTLVELADSHPVALMGPRGPTQVSELPKEVVSLIKIRKAGKKEFFPPKIAAAEGAWPNFAMAVALEARSRKKVLPYELWAYNFECLTPESREFVDKKLRPSLTKDEEIKLAAAQNQGWPNFPRILDELARNHHLQVPWLTLPGPRQFWDKYRLKKAAQGFPQLPEHMLRDFAQFEMTPQERATLNVSLNDPATLERAAPLFFERKPHLHKQLRQVDQARRPRTTDGTFINVPAPRNEKAGIN